MTTKTLTKVGKMNTLDLVNLEFVLIWFGMAIMGILAGLGAIIFGVIGVFSGNLIYWSTPMLDCVEIVISLFISTFILGVINGSSLKKQKGKTGFLLRWANG